MEEQKRYYRIETYLKGKMTDAEASQFEYQMLLDPDLKHEVSVQKWAMEALKLDYRDKLSDLIRERGNEYKPEGKTIKWWMYGAILLLGMLMGGAFIYQNSEVAKPKEEKLASVIVAKQEEAVVEITQTSVSDSVTGLQKAPGENVPQPSKADPRIFPKTDSPEPVKDTIKQLVHTEEVDTLRTTESMAKMSPEINTVNNTETIDSVHAPEKEDCLSPPNVDFEVTPAHRGYQDGTVSIFSISGEEHLFALIPLQEGYLPNRFVKNVPAGKYELKAKTGSCFYNLGLVEVPETVCEPERDYTFNVIFDQNFRVPIPDRSSGQIKIINKAGLEVFTQHFEAGQEVIWQGNGQNGSETQSGIHKLVVKTSQETCIYNVVVAK